MTDSRTFTAELWSLDVGDMTDSRSNTIRTFVKLHGREPDMQSARDCAELWSFANANADRCHPLVSGGLVRRNPPRAVRPAKARVEPVE